MMPYGNRDLGQHWFRQWLVAWWHQAITWTNVDLASVRSIGIHLSTILWEILQPSITRIGWRITFLKFLWNLPGANELTQQSRVTHICISKVGHPSDNGLLPLQCQAITWTIADLLSIRSKKHISMKLYLKFRHFHSGRCIWKCLQNVSHSVSASMCWMKIPASSWSN